MRIAVTADPYLPVPPRFYGGIERVVDFLVRGLVLRGHDVTLFAHPDSTASMRLVPYGMPPHHGPRARVAEIWQLGAALWQRRREFDLIHSFGRLASLIPVLPYRQLPKVQSYQRDRIPWPSVRTAVRVAGASIAFTACSASVFRNRPLQGPKAGEWHAIYNGVEMAKFIFVPEVPPDAPLVFLGRLDRTKGTHAAIAVAKRTGRRLVIAGNQVKTGPDAAYFDREIAPYVDGRQIQYVGPVDDIQKNALLGRAAALLMPIEWEEPFGIVMAEALACGTPVIGFARGSVPEVVREGISGFACSDIAEMAMCVERLNEIDRAHCRAEAERRFSDDVIVNDYEQLYRKMVAVYHPASN